AAPRPAAFPHAIPLPGGAAEVFGGLAYRPYQGWFIAFLAEAYRLKGDQDQASELAGKAFQIGSDSHVWVVTGWARHSFGRIALSCGDLAEAEKQLSEALRIFDSITSRYEMASLHMAPPSLGPPTPPPPP